MSIQLSGRDAGMLVHVSTTLPERETAERLGASLVERRLAACVQVVGPVASTYRWQGTVESASEWLCLIKTTRAAYPRIEAAIREAHPYDMPEIVATEIVTGDVAYLDWIRDSVAEE